MEFKVIETQEAVRATDVPEKSFGVCDGNLVYKDTDGYITNLSTGETLEADDFSGVIRVYNPGTALEVTT
jgi:hypothetical protein